MAVKTVSNSGGNWNSTSTWTDGIVPVNGDEVVFTSTSGNLVVNVSTANLIGIDFTNYLGTITFNNNINVGTSINLGSGGYAQSGTTGLVIYSSTTITSNGVTWTRNLTLNSGTIILTLNDNFNLTGTFSATGLGGSLTLSFNGTGQFLPYGDFIVSNTSVTGVATITITLPNDISITSLLYPVQSNSANARNVILNGNKNINVSGNISILGINSMNFSGNCTLIASGSGNFSVGNVSGIVFTPIVSIPTTISGNYNFQFFPIFTSTIVTHTSGSVTGAQVIFSNCTLGLNSGQWGTSVIIRGTTTLLNDTIFGNLTTDSTTVNFIGSYNISVKGNFTVNISTNGASTPILLDGTGNQTWSHSLNAYLSNTLTINKTSGSLILGTSIYYQTGSLTYVNSGSTVSSVGNTLYIGSSCILDTSGITWNNVALDNGTITLTLLSDFNISGNFSANGNNGNLTLSFNVSGGTQFLPTGGFQIGSGSISVPTSGTITITLPNDIYVTTFNSNQGGSYYRNLVLNGNKIINVSGNIGLLNGSVASASLTGNCTIKAIGNGNITCGIVSGPQYTGSISIPLEIDSGLGTYNFVYYPFFTSSIITYTSGVLTGTAVRFTTCTLNLNNGGQWGTDVVIRGNTTLTSDATFTNLTTDTTAVVFSGSYTINVKGNFNVNITTSGANTPIILNGNGSQNWSSTAYLSNNLTINKLAGTLSLGSVIYYQTGLLTHTSGNVITSGNTLWLNTCSLETSGMTWGNVTTNSGTVNLKLNSAFNISNTFLVFGGNATLTFTGGTGTFNPMGEFNLGDANTIAGVTTKNITLPNDITVSSFFVSQIQGLSNYRNIVLNGSKRINVTGNITISSGSNGVAGGISGNCTLGLIGGGNYIQGGASGGVSMSLPVVVDTIGTYNFQFFPSFQSSVNYIQGTITGATTYFTNTTLNFNAGLKWGTSAILAGNTTLQTNVTFGNLTTQTTNVVFSGTSNVNVEGNLAINITTSNAVGSTNTILLNGTSSQSWTTTGYYLSTPLTIDKSSGVLTIGSVSLPNVYYQTGTLRHLLGTVDTSTTLSVLNLGSNPILSTSGITWYNIANITTSTTSLLNDFIWSNNWSIGNAYTITFSGSSGNLAPLPTANIVFNGGPSVTLKNNIQITNATLGIATINTNQISLSGNLSVTGSVGGTTNILFNGSGVQSWAHPSASYISNNITINKSGGTLTLGSNIYYNTNTLTRTAGNVNTTTNNTTLNINASCTLATQGITWNAINWVGGTITLSNPLTAIGVITVTHSFPILNGSDLYANGGMNYTALNLSTNFAYMSGNATIRFEGTGSWNSSQQGTYQNNVIINPTGNFSINVYYALGTITYDSTNGGNVTSAYVTLGYYTALSSRGLTRSTTFNTNTMRWDYIYCMSYTDSGGGTTSNITCLSNLNVNYMGFSGIGVVAGDVWNFIMSTDANLVNVGNFNLDARCTINLAKDFTTKTLSFSTGIFQRLNNGLVTITDLLTSSSSQGAINITGSAKLILGDNCSWQRGDNNTALYFNMEFKGSVKFGTPSFPIMYFYNNSIEYTGYNSKPSKATGTLYIASNATLTNFNRLSFSNLIIGAGLTLTMNEFFSGYNDFKCNVSSSSSASNFNVNLTMSNEKIVKYLNISNCTLNRDGQILVVTNSRKNTRNRGLRYINDLPNGLPENDSKIINNQFYGLSEKPFIIDPNMTSY